MSLNRSLTGGGLGNGSGSGSGLVSIQTATVTISAGTSLSNSIDCRNLGLLVAVLFSVVWTSAKLGFQASVDNVNFFDVIDASGTDVITRNPSSAGQWLGMTNASSSVAVPVGAVGAPYLKLRSGAASALVNQAADRILTLTFQK